MPGALGWRGYLWADSYIFPFTSCDISKVTELYPSAAIHGGGLNTVEGYYHSQHNVAQGRTIVQGRISGEVFVGTNNYASGFKALVKRAIGAQYSDTSLRDTGFNASSPIIFNPGRSNQLLMPATGDAVRKAVIASMTLRGNPSGIVGCEFELQSAGADDATATVPTFANFAYEEECQLPDDSKPVPFWDSAFAVGACAGETDLEDRITDWSITVNNNTTGIWAFNGQQLAVDILQGIMEVTGTFSYYSADGSFVADLVHGADLVLTLGNTGGNPIVLKSPYLAFDTSPIPSTGPNAPVYRNVTFRCLAMNEKSSLYIDSGL